MSKLNEHTEYLPAFSNPEYNIDAKYNVAFLNLNKEISYLDNSAKMQVFVCPLIIELAEKDIIEFKAYAHKVHNAEHIVTVDGGKRGKGMFCIFKRNNK